VIALAWLVVLSALFAVDLVQITRGLRGGAR